MLESGQGGTDDPSDLDFRIHLLLVHEAGHALVILGTRYDHPEMFDSIMSYGNHIPENLGEPECSPHPFDIMAIYALYQRIAP